MGDHRIVGSIAFALELWSRHRRNFPENSDGRSHVTIQDVPADVMILHDVRDVILGGTNQQNRATDGHRAIDLARMNYPGNRIADCDDVHIGR